jgi:non-specific serine/threonine protein kinase/serine/threonine-protein kinase
MFDVHGAIQELPGSTPARKMLVDNSLKYLEALTAESGSEPRLQRELASAYEKVADVQGGFRAASLGDTGGAISSYRKALAMREALAAANPQDRDLRRELLRNHGKVSEILTGNGDIEAALDSSRRATKLAQELVAMPDATVEDRRNLATALLNFGWQLARTPRVGDGILFIRQAVAAFDKLHAEFPRDFVVTRNLALAHSRLGETLRERTQDWSGALDAHRKSLAIAEAMLEGDPRNTNLTRMVGWERINIGAALYELGELRPALASQIAAMDLLRPLLDRDTRNETARYDTVFAMSEISKTLLALGELKPARTQLTESLNLLSQASDLSDTDVTNNRMLLGLIYTRLGLTHALEAGQPSATRAARNRSCAEAEHWLALGEPIVIAGAKQNEQWRYLARGLAEQVTQQAATCTKAIPVSR